MKRGEIYYISRRDAIGSEVMKARPAVIVSNDVLNRTSEVVEVVYLTTSPRRKEFPTHVTIHATGTESFSLCENIDHISTLLVGDYCGACNDAEMKAIDEALMVSLGLKDPEKPTKEEPKEEPTEEDLRVALAAASAERDVYKRLVDAALLWNGGIVR